MGSQSELVFMKVGNNKTSPPVMLGRFCIQPVPFLLLHHAVTQSRAKEMGRANFECPVTTTVT
jgi:hypothetical protein